VEVFNLSRVSRLTAFPKMTLEEFSARAGKAVSRAAENTVLAQAGLTVEPNGNGASHKLIPDAAKAGVVVPANVARGGNGHGCASVSPKVFVVNYKFLTCGEVFGTGLRHGAAQLGVTYESAMWDDPKLPLKVEQFQPDLIFVVHGRRFVQKWGSRFSRYRTAVWLVDEPYEVDDTARWSGAFQTVFVNDPTTLSRHKNAHYLPVCFDPHLHRDGGLPRVYQAGFIGGYNETRERWLGEMAGAGLLSYVVGGPWKSPALRRLAPATNVPPERTTELYQQTHVVLNVFRDIHHFNREQISARSMNPRIYEALACGALVLSEPRPEIMEVFPELPTFESARSMLMTLERLLSDESHRRDLLEKSRARLTGHSYSDRLAHVIRTCLAIETDPAQALTAMEERAMNLSTVTTEMAEQALQEMTPHVSLTPFKEWHSYGDAAQASDDGQVTLLKQFSSAPGSETGLVSVRSYHNVELSFELRLDRDAWFIAKIHQQEKTDQKANSYHLVCEPKASYVAKHNRVLGHLRIARGVWQKVSFRWANRLLEVLVNGIAAIRIPEGHLQSGYCFLGVKGGQARLRKIQLTETAEAAATALPNAAEGLSTSDGETDRRPGSTRTETLPQPGADVWPFTKMPRRNLIYHIWPVRGAMWSWNLDQLKSRLDIFNGRRIIGIVHDDRSVQPEQVQEYLEGHGFEFVIARNDERGEAITFPLMMQMIASDDPDEVTFYGHAKGVKYEPRIPLPVRRWSEVQYRVSLDDWLTVREQLERFAMTGPFKRQGRFHSHQFLADWHYSGTYFWMRNAHLFSRNTSDVPQFYGGVETWPGMVFRKEETTCLFIDNLREHPYHEQFWRKTAEPAFRRWESGVRPCPPPPDLVRPLPYEGYTEPRMEQKPEEFGWWVEWLLKMNVSRLLTIGSKEGGVEWHLARTFFEKGRTIEITAIEKNPAPQLMRTFQDAEQRFHQPLKLVTADSTSPSLKAQLADQYDAVFIDGDHSYRGCRSDFMLAQSLKPKLIGLHDIVDSDWHTSARCCVSRLWAELSSQYRTEHRASVEWGGIGVVIL
jgi:hypothetical protein